MLQLFEHLVQIKSSNPDIFLLYKPSHHKILFSIYLVANGVLSNSEFRIIFTVSAMDEVLIKVFRRL